MRYKLRINKVQMSLFIVVFLLRILLDVGYYSVISIQYSYFGFHDNHTSKLYFISWLILLISLFFVASIFSFIDDRPSGLIATVLYLLSFVPFTTCVSAGIFSTGFICCNCIYWLVLIFAEIVSLSNPVRPFWRIKANKWVFNEKDAWVLGLVSLAVVLYISGRYTHFRLNFNLYSVYDFRLEARTYNFPKIIEYLFAWTKAINPILFAYSVVKKNRGMAILFFAAQMLSFGVDGLKSTFFMPFLVLIAFFIYKRINAKQLKMIIAICLDGVALISVLEYFLFHSWFVLEIIIRRVMFVPNYLSHCYYDFFQSNVPDYFRSSFLRHLGFLSPYNLSTGGITYIIGAQYFSKPTMNCNNGLIADALTNLGLPGLVIMPILLILLLRLLDRSTITTDKRLHVASALYLSYIVLSSFLMTVLITHGMLILIILLSLLGDRKRKHNGVLLNNKL